MVMKYNLHTFFLIVLVILGLTSCTLKYKNDVHGSAGEDADFLPGTCSFNLSLLAQYQAIKCNFESPFFRKKKKKTSQLETLKSQREMAFSTD